MSPVTGGDGGSSTSLRVKTYGNRGVFLPPCVWPGGDRKTIGRGSGLTGASTARVELPTTQCGLRPGPGLRRSEVTGSHGRRTSHLPVVPLPRVRMGGGGGAEPVTRKVLTHDGSFCFMSEVTLPVVQSVQGRASSTGVRISHSDR